MGNIPSSDLSKADVDLDKEILGLQTSAFFNDKFVSGLVEKVPMYGYPDAQPCAGSDSSSTNVEEAKTDENEQRLEKFMTIFSSDLSGCSKVEDFPILSVDKSLANSGFSVMSSRRSRLLIRLFQAYSNQLAEIKSAASQSNKNSGAVNGLYWQLPLDEEKGHSASEEEILSNLSLNMSLTLARAFGNQNPAVAKAILQTLLDGLVLYKPLSFRSTPGLEHTLNSIRKFATEMLTISADAEVKALALSLQMTMGLLVGSVMTIIQSIEMLGEHDLVLHDKVLDMIEKCIQIPADFDISFPNTKSPHDKFAIPLEVPDDKKSSKTIPQMISITCDGTFYYLYDGFARTLSKIGSGLNGTIPGEIVCISKPLVSVIRELDLKEDKDSVEKENAEESAGENASSDGLLLFSRTKKSDFITLRDGDRTAMNESDDEGIFRTVLIDQIFPAQNGRDFTGRSYFEITVEAHPDDAPIAIGWCTSGFQLDGEELLGWVDGTYAFHSDGEFHGSGVTSDDDSDQEEPSWNEGDVIGCGIDYNELKVFFTFNGHVVARPFSLADSNVSELYPAVAMDRGCGVSLNTGQSPFRYSGNLASGPMMGNNVRGKTQVVDKSHLLASLTVSGSKLYAHFNQGLDSRNVAVFHTANLEFAGLLELTSAMQCQPSDSEDASASPSDEIFSFDIDPRQQDTLNIRATKGYKIEVMEAFLGDIDVVDTLEDLRNSSGDSIFTKSIRESFFSTTTGTLRIKCKAVPKEVNRLCLPIASTENALFLIEETNGSSSSAKRVYDVLKEIQFSSATAGAPSRDDFDVLPIVQQLWMNYLEKLHKHQLKAGDSTSFQEDFKAILGTDAVESLEEDNQQESTENDETEKKSSRLNLSFVFSGNQKSSVNFTESCQWDLILSELEDVVDHRTPAFNALKVQLGGEVPVITARCPLLCRGYDSLKADLLDSSSLICNGHQLMVISPLLASADTVRARGWKFSLDKTGEIQRFYNKKFANKGCGTPTSFCFDVRNNMIVGFDSSSLSVLKWRNAGFSPSSPTVVEAEKDSLLDSSPAHRLQLLWQQFKSTKEAKLQVAILISLLDKLSEPYGANDLSGSANIDALNQVKLTAKWTSGSSEKNRCAITICDNVVEFDDDGDDDNNHDGYHIVVLNKHTFSVEKTRWFNNDNADSANRMGDFLNDLEEGSIVLLANTGSVHDNMGRYTIEALMSYGACDLETVERSRSFVMIGIKGLKPGTADYAFGESGEAVKLLRFLPPRAIPLTLEPSPDALAALLKLNKQLFAAAQPQGDVFSYLCFSSALRLLQVNLYNFTHRSKPENALKSFEGERSREVKDFLENLMSSSLMDIPVVRTAGVGLFFASLALVFPRTEDQVLLFEGYAKKYQNGSISDAELSLLQVLLRRFLKANDLISVSKNGKLEYANILSLIEVVQLIIAQETKGLVQHALSAQVDAVENPIYAAAVQLLTSLSKSVLAFAAEPLIKGSDILSSSSQEITRIFQVVSIISKLSSNLLQNIVDFKSQHQEITLDTACVLAMLQRSPVGSILPITTITVSELVRSWGYKFISVSMESVLGAINELDECLSHMNSVLSLLSPEASQYDDTIPQVQSSSKVFESEHPYRSNMDERTIISFPGALGVTITFDSKTRSEHSCDYIIFQDRNGTSLHPQIDRLSGRDGNENWPGFGNRPPLTINSNDFVCYFHSDGSVEDWGYKFTVTANYPLKVTSTNRFNWLAKLSFELVQSLSLIGAGMIQGTPWNEEIEKSCEGWMENPLVKPEYFNNPNHDTLLSSDADKFLHGLFDRQTNTIADKFLRKIRVHVPEDQGTIDVVNRAVYATCAAIIRGNNLTAEAMAFANGTVSEPSPALIKAWRAGQKMRNYFVLNDVKVSMGVQPAQSGKSKLQSSIYAGAPEEVIKAASEAVITRAKFLLRSTSKSSGAEESTETTIATDNTPPNLSLLGPSLPSGSSHGSENSSPERSADGSPVNKWVLATKAIKLQRQVSHETRNVQAMWHSLVDEVVVLDKLKNVFLQRRKFVEKSKISKELTLTEKILNFVQSDVMIDKLHDVNLIRNKRAIVRSKGFDVFTRLLHEKSSPFAIFITATTYINALTKFRRQDGNNSENLHFAHSLEGCSPEQNQLLWQKFFSFLTSCVSTILRSHSSLNVCAPADVVVWEKALVNALRACAMDYDVTDHQTIYESDIVTVLEQILRGKGSMLVKQTANALLEIIVSRFIVFDSSSETGEPTELNKSLISMLAKLLAESKKEIAPSSASASALPSTDYSLTDMVSPLLAIDELVVVRSMAGGRVIPHFDLPFDHTISFSVGREKSSIDSFVPGNILPGSRVMRSIYWKEDKARSDGGLGAIGVITGVIENGKKVSVKWPHGKEYMYTIGLDNTDSEGQPEVVLADPQLAGCLFSKGSSIVADDEEMKKSTPVILTMSGQTLSDGTLLITYEYLDKTLVHIRTKERIPPSKWTHFAISTDCQSRLSLYVDGKCVQSEQIPSVKTCGSASLSLTNSNETFALPTIDSAASFVVWMEEVSAFPAAGLNLLVQSGDNVQKMVNFESVTDLPGNHGPALRLNDAQSSLAFMSWNSDQEFNMNAAVKGISAADAQSLAKSTTRLPWYIGHPSAYQFIPLSVTPSGTNMLMREFTVFGAPLSALAIRHLASWARECAKFDEEDARKANEIPVLDVLGVLRRSLSNLDNLAESPMRRCFANCGIITMLFEQFASAMPNIRIAAYQLASHIFPAMDIELIDGNGIRAQLYANGETFLDFLCGEIGRGFNTWRHRARAASQSPLSLQFTDTDLHSIISAQLLLLRSFSMGRKDWQERFSETLKTLLDSAIDTLPHLKSVARDSFALTTTWDEDHLAIADRIFSVLAIIGGTPLGKLGPGSRVSYIDENTGMVEPAIVLGPAAIPPIDTKNKDSLKRWSFAKNFGDAVAILLDSDPKNSLVVPVHTLVSTMDNISVPARIFELLKDQIGGEKLTMFFRELISIDLSDPRPKRGPIEVIVEEEKVFESAHPYPNNQSHYEPISFEGADKIEIVFDEQSRTEDGCDYVLFYKDNSRKSTYGDKCMGRNGNENFPGFGGRAPLTIPSSSAVLHFYSDSSGNDWGYKFTAKAKCRKQVFPPELPPVPNHFLLSNLKMLGMKAVMLMTKCDWVLESLVALLPQIIQSALSPKPETTVMANSGSSSEQLMFESSHPYADGMGQYTPVHVPGATRFIITFDQETRTESNCDYLIFYTDDSHSTKVPDSETYTGGKDGSSSNWPGINGKPPLVIEGDSFVYFFHSDSSVNDWGFRMYITVEKNSPGGSKSALVRGAGMDALQAETCSCILQGLLNDGVGFVDDAVYSTLPKFAIVQAQTSVPPFILSLKKTYGRIEESKEEDDQLIESKTDDDGVATSLIVPAQRHVVTRVNPPKTKLFATVSVADMHLFSEPNKDSNKLEALSVGQKLIIYESGPDAFSSSEAEWLKAEKVSDFESESSSNTSGWITRRAPSGDLSFAVENFGEVIITELSDEQLSIDSKSKKQNDKSKVQEYRNPMYCVENGKPGATDGAGEKLQRNTIREADVVARDYLFVDQAIAEYNAIAAINYANQGVAKFLEYWPEKLIFSDLYFGSAENLLSYLNVCLADLDVKDVLNTSAIVNKSSKTMGVRHLLDIVIRDASKRDTFHEHIPAVMMLRCAQQLLEDSTMQSTEKLCKPVKRGKRSSIESAHPYDHNLNQDWPLSFPGAKKLELSFTEMSATETNYDYITIYTDSSKSTKAYSEKIHGYRNTTQRHWPGVNVPPVIIDGSSCVVNFTTDGGTNDWGFKLDIFAVYEEPSEAEIRAYASNLSAPTQSPAKLALVIFHYFTTQFSALSPLLRHVLFTIENFRTLIKFFNSPVSSSFRAQLLDIFVVFTNAFMNDETHATEIVRELSELEKSLVGYANEQYSVETNKGARTQGATPELQSTVQMIITLQAAIGSIRDRFSENDTKAQNSLSLKSILVDSSVSADPSYRTLYHPESTNSKSVIAWEIRLKRIVDVTKLPFVGFVTDTRNKRPASCHVGHSSAASTEVSLSGLSVFVNGANVEATKCKQWSEGDVLVMRLDRLNGTLEYSLNGASLPLIIGPPAKTPLFEVNIVGIDCFFAVSLAHPGDEVEVRYLDKSSPGVAAAATSSTSSLDWLQPVREVQSILQSIANKKIPESIISTKFLPFCNKKSTIHWQVTPEEFASASKFEKELFFPSASQISLVVEESALQNCDVIEFFNRSGDLLLAICGDAFTVSNVSKLTAFINKATARSVERSKNNSSLSSSTRARLATVGDKVTRGPYWEFGNEDGGLGSVGEVIEAHVIGTKPPTVVVRWPNGVEASYLNSNDASQQVVTIFETALSANASSSFQRAADGSFTFVEEYVKIRIQCNAKSASGETEAVSSKERKLSVHIVPCLSAAHCFQNPSFQAFRDYLSSLYVVKNRAALSSFVKHINKVAREKNLSLEEILHKKWTDVSPSAEDLTRSAVLKELFDSEPLALSEEDLAVISQNLVFERSKSTQPGESSAAAAEEEDEEEDGAPEGEIQLSDPYRGFYLSEYASWGGIHEFESLEFALMAARQVYPACQGITQEGRQSFTLRAGNALLPSPSGETSWLLVPPPTRKKRKVVVDQSAVARGGEEIHAISSEIADEAVSLRSSRSASVASLVLEDATENSSTVEVADHDSGTEEAGPDEETATVIDEELHDNDVEEEEEEEEFNPIELNIGDEFSNYGEDDCDAYHNDTEEEEDAQRRSRTISSNSSESSVRSQRGRTLRRSPLTTLPEPILDSDELCTPVPSVMMPCCAKCSKSLRLHPAGTWGNGWSCDWPEHQGPNSFMASDPVYGCETIRPCNWGVCVTCWERIAARGKAAEDLLAHKLRNNTLTANMRPIEALFDLLLLLNNSLIKALPLIDLTRKEKIPGTLSHLISSNRDLIFEVVKKKPFDEAVSSTTGSGGQFDLFLSRFRARKNAAAGKVDTDGRWSVFSQAFRVMHSMNPSTLRRPDRLYSTKFMGEHAQDAGGPYRESFDNYAEELQSPVLPLFIRTPNGRHAVGYNREKWILNPNATSSVQLEMLAFVGKLMGIAIRSKEYMSFNIPSFIWKLIAGDVPTKEDLEGIDFSLVNSLDLLRNIDKNGVDEITFSSTFFETFTTTSSDDRVVELVAGGKDIDVTFGNRHQYCDLVMQYRLHEFDKQAAAIREGLATIIPISLLSMYRWDELEEMVCGKPEIDIKLLESVAEYSSCQPTDAHIRLFWQAMEEFNNEERSAFIKFTWGRSRLPLNAGGFTQRFKLQSFDKSPADNYLPVAHTCFFSLELPRYSTLEIMKEKLRYAIFNCQAIDGDNTSTGMTVAAMGWEDEEE